MTVMALHLAEHRRIEARNGESRPEAAPATAACHAPVEYLADVAQLEERHLAMVEAAGSSPAVRLHRRIEQGTGASSPARSLLGAAALSASPVIAPIGEASSCHCGRRAVVRGLCLADYERFCDLRDELARDPEAGS